MSGYTCKLGVLHCLLTVISIMIITAFAQYENEENDLYTYGDDTYGYDVGYGYGYDTYGYGGYDMDMDNDDGSDVTQNAYYNYYGYYGNEDQAYYEYYGYYADDQYGYEDYYLDVIDTTEECIIGSSGKPELINGTAPCSIKISGVNKQAPKLIGGIDGTYQLTSCYNGKAMYKRMKSPTGEDRVLWYSSTFGDWDVSRGSEPNEAEILMYGGEMEHASVPLFVSSWHLGADVKDTLDSLDDEFMPVKAKVICADGKVYKPTSQSNGDQLGLILTDDEMEMKYRIIYNKYGQSDNNPTLSFTFVALLVMIGLTFILAIPYFLLRKKVSKASSTSSFAQILQDTRKRNRGHVN